MGWYLVVKEIVEIIYMLSGIGIIIGLFFAFKQLKMMREDYDTKNKRASIEKSIEYLNLFATTIIPISAKFSADIEKLKLQEYRGLKSKAFRFDRHCNPQSEYIIELIEAAIKCKASDILNQLEYFSAAMMSGLADEELAFTPLAETYCETVEELYVILCYTRVKESSNAFSNTIELYGNWKSRLEKHHLEKDREKIDERISKIEPKNIQSIWKAK